MKSLQLILLVCLTVMASQVFSKPPASYSSSLQTEIQLTEKDKENLSDKINILMTQYQVPGLAIAVVDAKGILWAKGFGVRKSGEPALVTPETLFSIESQTKMFTALGVLRAVQAGQLNLNTPIYKYLPYLKVYSVFQKDPVKLITLKNLLSHTAGFPHEAPIGNNYNSDVSFSEHMQSILTGLWLQFPVGQGYNYSNVGIDLAGYILQITSQMSYEKYMQRAVFNPLDMTHSTFSMKDFQDDNHASGFIPGLKVVPINHAIIPAGGLYSNVLEMSHYLEFQLNSGKYQKQQILTPSLLKTMLTLPFPQPGQSEGYALGIWKGKRLNTIYYSHLGRGFGFASVLEWYPDYGLGVVVLTNKYDMNNVDIKVAHLLIAPLINQAIKKQSALLISAMQGTYVSNGGSIHLEGNKDDQLVLSGEVNYGSTENDIAHIQETLVYVGRNEFYSPKTHERYRFMKLGITGVKTFERISDAYIWFFNENVDEKSGPNKKNWEQYTGVYNLYGYGPVISNRVHVQNGYLYMNSICLIQKRSNVFITPNGQVLVFKGKNLNWAGLTLLKQNSY